MASEVLHLRALCASTLESGEKSGVSRTVFCLLDDADKIRLVRFMTNESLHEHELLVMEACKAFIMDRETSCSAASTSTSLSTLFSMKECIASMISLPRGTRSSSGNAETCQWEQLRAIVDEQERTAKKLSNDLRHQVHMHVVGKANVIPPIVQSGKYITLTILSQCLSRLVPVTTDASLSLQEFLRLPTLNEEGESGRGGGGGGGEKTKTKKKMKHSLSSSSSSGSGEHEGSLSSISTLVSTLGQYCLSFLSSSETCASFSAACVTCSHLLLEIGNESRDILHGIVFALLELVEEEEERKGTQCDDFFRTYFPRACFVATVCERLISNHLISLDAFMLDNVLELFGWLVGSLLCMCELNVAHDEAANSSSCIAHLQSTLSSLFFQSNHVLVVHLTRHLAANLKSQTAEADDGMRGGFSKKCFETLSSKSAQERVETFQVAIDKVFPIEDQDLVSSLVAVSPNPRLLLHSYGLVCCLRNSFSLGHDSYFGLGCGSGGSGSGDGGDGRKKDGLYDCLITVQAMHELYRIFPVLFIRILVDAIAQVVSKKQVALQASDLVDVEALMKLLDGITNSFCINVFDLLCYSLPSIAWRPKDSVLSARNALLAPSSGSFASIIFLRYLSNQLFSSQLASWLITFGSQKPFSCIDFLSLCHMLATNPSASESGKGRHLVEKEKLQILLNRLGRTLTSSVEAAHASFATICSVANFMSESLASPGSLLRANSPTSSSPVPTIAASSSLPSYTETPSQLQPDDVPSALFVVEGLEHKLVSDFARKREAAVIDFFQGARGAVKANCSWHVTQVINRLVCSLDGEISNSDLKRIVQNLVARRDCFASLVQQQQKSNSLGARGDGNLAVFCPLEKKLYARGGDQQQRSRSSSNTMLLAAISLPMFENLLTAGSGSTPLDASEIQASLYHRGLLCCDWISLTFTTIHAIYNVLCHKQQQMRARVPMSFSGSSIYLDEGFVKAIHGHRGNFVLPAIANALQFHLTSLAMQAQSCISSVVNGSAIHFSYILACIELVGACGEVRMLSSLAIMVMDKSTLAVCVNALILGNDVDRLDEARTHAQSHLKVAISHFILVFVSTFEKMASFLVDEQATLANAMPLLSLGALILVTGSVEDGHRQSLTDNLAQIGTFISRSACVAKWLEGSESSSASEEESFSACKRRDEAVELIVMCESTSSLRPIRMTLVGTGIRPGRSMNLTCEQLEGALVSPDLFLPFERQAALQLVVLPSFEFLWESLLRLTSSPSSNLSFQAQDLIETNGKSRVEASLPKNWAQEDSCVTQHEAEDFSLQALLQHLCDAFYVPVEFEGKTATAQLALLDSFLSSLCWKRNDTTSLLVSRLASWHLSSPRNCADVCSSSPFWVLNRIGTFVRNTVLVRCHTHELQVDVVGAHLLAALKILDIVPPRGVIAWRQSASRGGGGGGTGQDKMEIEDGMSMLTDEDLCSKAMQDVATLLEAASRFKNDGSGVSNSVWQALLYYLIGTVYASYSTQHKQLLEEHCRAKTDEEEDDIEVTSVSTLLHNLSISLVHLSSTKRGRDEKPVEATFLHNLRWACTHCKYLSVLEPISRLQRRLHNLGYRDMIVAEAFYTPATSSPFNFHVGGAVIHMSDVDSSRGIGGGGGGGGGGGDDKLSPNDGASPRILQSKRSPLKALIEKRGLEYGHEDSQAFVASPNKRRRGEEEVGIEASLRAETAVEEEDVQGGDSLIPELIDFESAVVAIKATSESVKNEEGWTVTVEKEEIAKKWGSSF